MGNVCCKSGVEDLETVALYDYKKQNEKELSFLKGQKIIVTDSKSIKNWYKGEYFDKDGNKNVGIFPSNFVCPPYALEIYDWYHPTLNRHAAEMMLRKPQIECGSFLVRQANSNQGNPDHVYTFSHKISDKRDGCDIRHYKIMKNFNGDLWIENNTTYKSLAELVESYSDHLKKNTYVKPMARVKPVFKTYNWELQRDRIKFGPVIGTGHYGIVHKGTLGDIDIAIKICKPDGKVDMKSLNSEANIMKELHHPNVITLHGLITNDLPILIITEYMENGSLLDFLSKTSNYPLLNKIGFGREICCGMEYLNQNNFLHRDLAARNVLLGRNMECKVADFGMSRKGSEYKTTSRKFPLKWTAIESFTHFIYSAKSDVWSFGITMYEILCDGKEPYANMEPRDICRFVENGGREKCPSHCPSELFDIIKTCWHENPADRPTFHDLDISLLEYIGKIEKDYFRSNEY